MKIVESSIYGRAGKVNVHLYIKHKSSYYKLRYLNKSNSLTWYKCITKQDSEDWDLSNTIKQVELNEGAVPTKVRNFAKEKLAKELI